MWRSFLNINFIERYVINFSVIFVPLCQEADDGVQQEDEEEAEDEDLLDTDLEHWCRDDQGRIPHCDLIIR